MSIRFWSRSLGVVVLALSVTVLATPRAEVSAQELPHVPAPSKTFIGRIDGHHDARIGVVFDGKKFIAYACGQEEKFTAEFSSWFKGECDGKKVSATNGDKTLTAAFDGDTLTGTLAAGDKKLAFKATVADTSIVAGLYRAEDLDGPDTVVFGWVVDEDGFVAGARQVKGQPTKPLPNNGILNGVNGQANPKAQPVRGEPVKNPAEPPKGVKGTKFDAERKKDFLDRLAAKTPRDGNPIMAGVVHLVKRFNSGAKAEGKIEEAAFAKMKSVPKQLLLDYEKNWDKIPAATRQRMLGSSAAGIDVRKPVTVELAKTLMGKLGLKTPGQPQPQAANVPVITSIKVKTLNCIKNTGSLFEGRDEIFAVYAGIAGDKSFSKVTEILTKVKGGETRNFPAADQLVFPPPDQPNLTSAFDVVVVASLFEADPNVGRIAGSMKVLIDTGLALVVILTAPAPPLAAGTLALVGPINLTIDQIASTFEGVQPLGDAEFLATVDEKVRSASGSGTINNLKYERKDKSGPAPFDYRLQGIEVKAK